MHVSPASNADEEHRYHETVDRDDPDTNHQVGFQICHDLRKPNYNDARVEGCHENSDGGNRQDNPFVLQENRRHNKQYFFQETGNPEYKVRPTKSEITARPPPEAEFASDRIRDLHTTSFPSMPS